MEIKEIALTMLKPNPHQMRRLVDEDADTELEASIASQGLIQPIVIASDPNHSGHYIVVAGERRYRAFIRLGRATIPAIVTAGDTDEIALLENVQRQNLHPLEEAYALHHLQQKHNYTQEKLSQVIGKPRSSIAQLLRLVKLPRQIQDECPTSDISKSVFIELASLPDKETQLEFWRQVQCGGLTIAQLREMKEGIKNLKEENNMSAKRTLRSCLSLADAIVKAGESFSGKLKKFAENSAPAEKEWLEKMRALHVQVNMLVEDIASKMQRAWDANQEHSLPVEDVSALVCYAAERTHDAIGA